MQTKALGPRWPRAHDVVAMLAIAGAVVTEQVRPVRDLDLIDAGSRVCQVEGIDAPICQDDRLGGLDVCLARSIVCHDPLVDLAGEEAF